MRGGTFQDVDLADARIGTLLNMTVTTVKSVLGMRGLEVGQHLLMRGGTVQDADLGRREGSRLLKPDSPDDWRLKVDPAP